MKKLFVVLLCLILLSASANAEFRVYLVYHAPGTTAAPYAEVPVLDTPPFDENADLLRVDFININVGDAILLSCGGETMLVDGGTLSKAEVLKFHLASRGIDELTYYFCSHSHDDHIETSTALVESGVKAKAYLSKYDADSKIPAVSKLMEALKAQGIPYRKLVPLDSVTLGGATLTFFQNMRTDVNHAVNARSMMMYVQFKNNNLLLTADVTGYSLAQVMEDYPQFMNVDIVKSPHHGIDRLRQEFIDFVSPELFVITGPNEQGTRLTDQLRRAKMPRYYTASGTVTLESDGSIWYVKQKPE